MDSSVFAIYLFFFSISHLIYLKSVSECALCLSCACHLPNLFSRAMKIGEYPWWKVLRGVAMIWSMMVRNEMSENEVAAIFLPVSRAFLDFPFFLCNLFFLFRPNYQCSTMIWSINFINWIIYGSLYSYIQKIEFGLLLIFHNLVTAISHWNFIELQD